MTDTPGSRDSSSSRFRVPVSGIFLVGFMGTGKTSVGKVLARQLGWEFVDLDARIEAREKLTVPEIFRRYGEKGFREREHQALKDLLEGLGKTMPVIVALGGGAFVQTENLELLLSAQTPSVFLDTPVEELWERCLEPGEPERPLRKDPAAFRALHEQRRPFYLRSAVRVETENKSVEEVAEKVLVSLGLQRAEGKENAQ
jgi:shikimate kinase